MARFTMPLFRTAIAAGCGLAVLSMCLGPPLALAQSTPKHVRTPAPKPPPAKQPPTQPEPPKPEAEKPPEPKTPPHFASLKRDRVNLRSGPSEDYPIQWEYHRKGLPVEVLAGFDVWRKVRDSDGTQGWINQQMLSDRRSVLIVGAVQGLMHDPQPEAEIVARIEPGVVAGLSKCDPSWCQVRVASYQGWLPREAIWGLAPGEAFP